MTAHVPISPAKMYLTICLLGEWDCGRGGEGRGALWFRTAMNPDLSTGPLARPFDRSLAPLTHSLALHCLLCSCAPLRSLGRSLAHSFPSLRGSVWLDVGKGPGFVKQCRREGGNKKVLWSMKNVVIWQDMTFTSEFSYRSHEKSIFCFHWRLMKFLPLTLLPPRLLLHQIPPISHCSRLHSSACLNVCQRS